MNCVGTYLLFLFHVHANKAICMHKCAVLIILLLEKHKKEKEKGALVTLATLNYTNRN